MENQIVLSMGSVLTILGGFGLIFGWFYRMIIKKFEIDMNSIKFDIGNLRADIKDIDVDIKELRDRLTAFEKNTEHRLTVLEMEAKNTNQRLSTIEGFLLPRKVLPFEEHQHDPDEPKEN